MSRYIDADKFERACMFDKNCNDMQDVIYKLRDYPTADVRENIRGEWIDYSDEGYVECPFCHSATNCEDNKDELHYCFSCGAELR